MSRFYASIDGNRSEATRQGSAASGIRGHIRGWNTGIFVRGRVHPGNDDTDLFVVSVSGGSSGGHPSRDVLRVFESSDKGTQYVEIWEPNTGTWIPYADIMAAWRSRPRTDSDT